MVLTTENKCKNKKDCCQTVVNVIAENAYDLWLKEGNKGTLGDYLESMKGEKGDKGDQGEPGPKGDKGDRLSIKDLFVNEGDMEELSKTLNKGDLVMMTNPSDPRHGTVYVWTGEEYQILTQLTKIDGTVGKSAYQTWLELGNTGSEQDFIDSLKAPEVDFTKHITRNQIEVNESVVTLTTSSRSSRVLNFNEKLGIGTLHLEFSLKENSDRILLVADLSKQGFKPSQPFRTVFHNGTKPDGTGDVTIGTSDTHPDVKYGVFVKNLKPNTEYTVDFTGFWDIL